MFFGNIDRLTCNLESTYSCHVSISALQRDAMSCKVRWAVNVRWSKGTAPTLHILKHYIIRKLPPRNHFVPIFESIIRTHCAYKPLNTTDTVHIFHILWCFVQYSIIDCFIYKCEETRGYDVVYRPEARPSKLLQHVRAPCHPLRALPRDPGRRI